MSHRFRVGQKVELVHRTMENAPRGQYEVRKLLPDSDRASGVPVYRIKSADETHERVAQERDLMSWRGS